MRYVNRASVAAPQSLVTPSLAVQNEKINAANYYLAHVVGDLPKPASYEFIHYKGYDVQRALRELFHGKCAYCECEISGDIDVEHYRPKGGVHEDPTHPGYWWLALEWENLLASCAHCNQKRMQHIVTEEMTVDELTAICAKPPQKSYGKGNHFPIHGVRATYGGSLAREQPHIIDPTTEDPEPYFEWSRLGDYSVVLAAPNDKWSTDRALSTISVFALNRVDLVVNRTKVLKMLRRLEDNIVSALERDMANGGQQSAVEAALEGVERMRLLQEPDSPYSAMCKAFCDDLVTRLLARLAGG